MSANNHSAPSAADPRSVASSERVHPRLHAAASPGKPAVVMGASGETISYAALEAQANRFAHWLRSQGIRTGDVIAFMVENHPRLFELIWGAQRSGVHYLLVPTSLVMPEAAYILADSESALVLMSRKSLKKAGEGISTLECTVVSLEDELLPQLAMLPATPIADEAPGADMLYTSGTTGRPKGLKSPIAATLDLPDRAVSIGRDRFSYKQAMVYLCPAPLYHAAPLRWSLAAHRLGGSVILMERFDPEAALALIDSHQVTVAQFVPTHFSRMLALPPEVRGRYDLSSLQAVFHAGAPCPVPVKRAMIDWLGPIVHEFYSGSEGLGITVINSQEWLRKPGSVGRPVIGSIRICGDDGEPLPNGQEGLVRFAGVRRFEYHGDPEKTAAAYNQHGWPTLGDIGRLDEEGFLFLTDRANFMIISGGVNIYPQEVENRLLDHPEVSDAGVVGLPDSEMGERVCAFIEPKCWPLIDEAAFAARLDSFARQGLSAIKVPRVYVFKENLPRTETGKLVKRALRDSYIPEIGTFPGSY